MGTSGADALKWLWEDRAYQARLDSSVVRALCFAGTNMHEGTPL